MLDEQAVKDQHIMEIDTFVSISLYKIKFNFFTTMFPNNAQCKEAVLFLPLGYLPSIYDDPLYPNNEPQTLDSMNSGKEFFITSTDIDGDFVAYFNISNNTEDIWYKFSYTIKNKRLYTYNNANIFYTNDILLNTNTIVQSPLQCMDIPIIFLLRKENVYMYPTEMLVQSDTEYWQPVTITVKSPLQYFYMETSLNPLKENVYMQPTEITVYCSLDILHYIVFTAIVIKEIILPVNMTAIIEENITDRKSVV